jgi:hypothetical protein
MKHRLPWPLAHRPDVRRSGRRVCRTDARQLLLGGPLQSYNCRRSFRRQSRSAQLSFMRHRFRACLLCPPCIFRWPLFESMLPAVLLQPGDLLPVRPMIRLRASAWRDS